MALKAVCDVFGTVKGTRQYRVTVVEVGPTGDIAASLMQRTMHFGPRGLKRFKTLLERGMASPGTETGEPDAPATT